MFIIGIVNYKSSVYIETQLKIYRDFAGEPFKIIIIDNSLNDKELKRLQKIVGKFSLPIEVIPFVPPGKYDSAAHGEGLQHIYEMICGRKEVADYFLTQDPDFFWVKPYFLTYLKKYLEEFTIVGAPYVSSKEAGWSGHPWFPCPWGTAYRLEALNRIGADFRWAPEFSPEGVCLKDVGWFIRKQLSNDPYYYFEQEPYTPIGICAFGEYNGRSRHYKDKGNSVAYHLIHGTFEMSPTKGIRLACGKAKKQQRLQRQMPPDEWQENRKKMCEIFWKEINEAAEQER